MDHSNLDPDMCRCRKTELPRLVATWARSAQARIEVAVQQGKPIDMNAVKHEAQLVASLAKGGAAAFAPQNTHYGHLCETCPYRKRAPMRSSLAVDPAAAAG